jgi:phosphatidate phosphatase PAH1
MEVSSFCVGVCFFFPFDVRFLFFQVSIHVNDELSPLRMKLGHAGEAFFEEEINPSPRKSSLAQSTPV